MKRPPAENPARRANAAMAPAPLRAVDKEENPTVLRKGRRGFLRLARGVPGVVAGWVMVAPNCRAAPPTAAASDAMARAQRDAESPMRRILEDSRASARKRAGSGVAPPEAAASHGVPSPPAATANVPKAARPAATPRASAPPPIGEALPPPAARAASDGAVPPLAAESRSGPESHEAMEAALGASAPPASTAPSAVTPSTADGLSSQAEEDYRQRVTAQLQAARRYPTGREASLQRSQGVVGVWFVLERSGKVAQAGVSQTSHSPMLDAAALAAVRRAAFPAFPASFQALSAEHRFTAELPFKPPD